MCLSFQSHLSSLKYLSCFVHYLHVDVSLKKVSLYNNPIFTKKKTKDSFTGNLTLPSHLPNKRRLS